MEYIITSLLAESEWKFYATAAIISEGSPSFILLATGILERRDASLSRTIHRRWCRTRSRTLHTQSLPPRSGIGPHHQQYAALSGLTSKGRKRDKEAAMFSCAAAAEYKQGISNKFPNPKSLNTARNHLVTQGPVSTTYSCLGSVRELPLLAPQWLQSDRRGRWSLSPLAGCNHDSPHTLL
jgi:hypothetical protein